MGGMIDQCGGRGESCDNCVQYDEVEVSLVTGGKAMWVGEGNCVNIGGEAVLHWGVYPC